MIEHNINDASGTLVVEWDNRPLAKNKLLTVFLPLYWIIWTPLTASVTWLVVVGEIGALGGVPGTLGGLLWIIGGYAIVILVALRWLTRYSKEHIELSRSEYRHCFVKYPRFFATRWHLADISKIEIGRHDEKYDLRKSIVTVNIWNGARRDILAYWANDKAKYEIFHIIARHLDSTEYRIEILDNYGSWQPPTRDGGKAESPFGSA